MTEADLPYYRARLRGIEIRLQHNSFPARGFRSLCFYIPHLLHGWNFRLPQTIDPLHELDVLTL